MSRIRHIRVLDYINSQQNIEFFQSFFSFFFLFGGAFLWEYKDHYYWTEVTLSLKLAVVSPSRV